MSSLTIISATILVLIAIFAAYIYLVGIPPELKRDLERKALRTMGENKASYLFQSQLDKVPDGPAGDVKEFKDVKKGLGNLGGEALKNPLGKTLGETGDEATRPFTGR
ncbi:hypothetical protein CKM354_000664500 [Cercospora kikuchii]|uniref:Uncharacterized protein n=1 Tax=Cercospora kikuchii TaxID=84275 RepID=A0A9P3CL71_9PEZI|nr:uncharacterized protein CKM354_000664500 [Cercospora kikuchii]GIZ43417.1 hypothetical protein CKM354_000664500 [Cercospora kikuchii]